MMILKSVEFNIDLNAYNYDGKTAFHEACSESNFEIVDLIIKKSIEFKIDLNARDDMQKTPFHRPFRSELIRPSFVYLVVSLMTEMSFRETSCSS